MTLGTDRVRIKFNPSGNNEVDLLKQMAADFIDQCELMRNKGSVDGEHQRLWSLAQTHMEDAAMWAVKAATF